MDKTADRFRNRPNGGRNKRGNRKTETEKQREKKGERGREQRRLKELLVLCEGSLVERGRGWIYRENVRVFYFIFIFLGQLRGCLSLGVGWRSERRGREKGPTKFLCFW